MFTEQSYYWLDALKETLYHGFHELGGDGFKYGQLKRFVTEEKSAMKILEDLQAIDSNDIEAQLLLPQEINTIADCCKHCEDMMIKHGAASIDEIPTGEDYEKLWEGFQCLNEMFANDAFERKKCVECLHRQIEYEFADGVLKTMKATDTMQKMRPRLWDPAFNREFATARKNKLAIEQAETKRMEDEEKDDDTSEDAEEETEDANANNDVESSENNQTEVQMKEEAGKGIGSNGMAEDVSEKLESLTLTGRKD
ncbi:hypothetical protein EYC84_005869 [Monilinia fructicola]|uniref:Uncharacterized protein n=1 Tax=Monilinia fructicola TaxID=38448 RepID=A0A5M9K0V7_MONFR|nr:hypothetical protein EYC84_005869 [Monilinia fructicola]